MTTEKLDFSQICRVCCLNGTLLSLFKVHLNRKLMACTSVKMWKDDGLPASICSKCVSKLHIAFQFKKTCEKSDAKLRHYLENVIDSKTEICQENTTTSTTQHIPQLQPQLQTSLQLQNYVYITECNPNISSIQCVNKPTNNKEITSSLVATTQPSQTYSLNSLGILEGLTNNGYAFQHVNVPVQYQTFSVPIDHQSNGATQPITSVPLQQFVSSNNQLEPTNESTIKNDGNPLAHVSETESNNKADSRTCSTCGKRFPTSAKLSRHMKTHSQTFTHRCKICHKGFTHGGNYKVHLRMHTDERPFSCTMCDHRCRQLQDLEKHKRKNNGEKPYICRYCSKGFSTSSNLISHERIHRKEKPYVCSICQKAFCQSNELTKHFRTHTQEKTHTCKVCQKGFNGSSTLIIHMRTHNGERPHICQHCHKGFTQSSCLKVHLKRHTDDGNDFQCDQCPRKFLTHTCLKEHMESHNGVDDITAH